MTEYDQDEVETLAIRMLCKMRGLTPTALDLHEYLIKNPGEHYQQALVKKFGCTRQAIGRAGACLLANGLIREVGNGGRADGNAGREPKGYVALRGKPVRERLRADARKMIKVVA